MLLTIDLIGIFVFAISGGLVAVRKELDIFGVLTLATVTGLGGGFIPAMTVLFAATATAFGRRAILADVAIGFVIGVVDLPCPGWATGVFFGLLLSAPSAVITKAWAPILGLGALGGLIIGMVVAHFTRISGAA